MAGFHKHTAVLWKVKVWSTEKGPAGTIQATFVANEVCCVHHLYTVFVVRYQLYVTEHTSGKSAEKYTLLQSDSGIILYCWLFTESPRFWILSLLTIYHGGEINPYACIWFCRLKVRIINPPDAKSLSSYPYKKWPPYNTRCAITPNDCVSSSIDFDFVPSKSFRSWYRVFIVSAKIWVLCHTHQNNYVKSC